MLHSTITAKGQTTIPGQIRRALGIKPGDRLTYEIGKDQVTFRVHPGLMALKGALSAGEVNNLPFSRIREKAAKTALRESKKRNS